MAFSNGKRSRTAEIFCLMPPEAEALEADVAANLFRGMEAVGGRMKITSSRILFEAHAFNIQREPAEILLEDISEIRKVNTLGIVPNGLLIRTKTGIDYRFVVWKRKHLIALIRRLMS